MLGKGIHTNLLAMNRKISVFILLILVATSFKYRSKSAESKVITGALKDSLVRIPQSSDSNVNKDFESFLSKLQAANEQFAKGDPSPFKALWSQEADITALGKLDQKQLKGWTAVEASLNDDGKILGTGTAYSFENIMTQVGVDLACVIQTEHYQPAHGKNVDLRVTILFRKEADGWKIVHRHAENMKLR